VASDNRRGDLLGHHRRTVVETRNRDYYYHAFALLSCMPSTSVFGVATGIPMEFQFGTNWAPSRKQLATFLAVSLGLRHPAFMLEAALGIMLFGWGVNPIILLSLYNSRLNLSTLWILTANSWMQTPAGGEMVEGKFVVHDYFQAIANPSMAKAFSICSWQHWKLRYL